MKRSLLLPFVLAPLVTAVVLIAVAWNRAEALAPIVLSERELSLRPRSDDNSVATMYLQWQQRTSRDGQINCAKLQALGLSCNIAPADRDAARHYSRVLPRRAFVAFELAGPAWEALMAERVKEMESAAQRGVPPHMNADKDFRERSSRLVAVDADGDAAVLRHRHPDSSRYLVTAAVLRVVLMAPPKEQPYVIGVIDRVDPGELHVPTELSTRLPPASAVPDADPRPRYRVWVRYGHRVEPWIVAIER